MCTFGVLGLSCETPAAPKLCVCVSRGVRRRGCPVEEMKKKTKHLKNNKTMCRNPKKSPKKRKRKNQNFKKKTKK